ncbi:MAG: GIY-YIG nuclease family protein [Rhodobacterales bacterium]|nr:GIY-YIG nuclease family protein [Rhodobacterales bacterium]
MGKGRSLELYFIDGKPDGMLTAEVFNWTGHVLMIPRTRIVDALKRGEAGYTGVYILLGETENGAQAYIGEAEDLGMRLRGHVAKKDWWETAVLITSTANNLHKAHVKYLESRLVEMAQETKRTPLENGNSPTRSSLSEAATANMEEFLETLMMVLPAIQVDMFVNKAKSSRSTAKTTSSPAVNHLFELVSPRLGIHATAELKDGEMILKKESIVREKWVGRASLNSGYKSLRDQLVENGILDQTMKSATFNTDYAFSSPSAAAAVVLGRAANGRTEWKLKGTNTTYAEWEAEQLNLKDIDQ